MRIILNTLIDPDRKNKNHQVLEATLFLFSLNKGMYGAIDKTTIKKVHVGEISNKKNQFKYNDIIINKWMYV